jgi:hypothetical protein
MSRSPRPCPSSKIGTQFQSCKALRALRRQPRFAEESQARHECRDEEDGADQLDGGFVRGMRTV